MQNTPVHHVPNSTGTAPPKFRAPPNATDCHIHIYELARFPVPKDAVPGMPGSAVADYRLLQKRIGTTRVVVVHPRNYGTDNSVSLDAIAQFGANARGIAVVTPDVTDAELKRLHDGGMRGVRFSLTANPKTWVVQPDMIEPMARRIADLGWHMQLAMEGDMIDQLSSMLRRLPATLVFDHLAKPPQPAGVEHSSHKLVRELLDKGRAWVKLSGAYSNSKLGPPYADSARVAQAFIKAAPERVVWGTDWPHPGVPADKEKPDDALLIDLLAEWAGDDAARNRILVENPEVLYDFGAAG